MLAGLLLYRGIVGRILRTASRSEAVECGPSGLLNSGIALRRSVLIVAAGRLSRRLPRMAEKPATVIVIDDDAGVREALGSLLRSVGLQARLHGSVPEFLKAGRPDGPTCLVLDVRLPGQSGLDFQRELTNSGAHLPIIFI